LQTDSGQDRTDRTSKKHKNKQILPLFADGNIMNHSFIVVDHRYIEQWLRGDFDLQSRIVLAIVAFDDD